MSPIDTAIGIIKDLYDITKDGGNLAVQRNSIKRALKTEAKLNRKFLHEIEQGRAINDSRRIEIIHMLEIKELSAAIQYEIPYLLISAKVDTEPITERYKSKKLIGEGLASILEKLYLAASFF